MKTLQMKKLTVEQEIKKLPISYIGGNFKAWFYPLPFSEGKTKSLFFKKLPRYMNDVEIQKELNPGEVSIKEVFETLKTINKDVWALFYCKDKGGVLRAVCVRWGGDGWLARADALGDDMWSVDYRVFSRNSFDTLTPVPLEPSLPSELTINGVIYKRQ